MELIKIYFRDYLKTKEDQLWLRFGQYTIPRIGEYISYKHKKYMVKDVEYDYDYKMVRVYCFESERINYV